MKVYAVVEASLGEVNEVRGGDRHAVEKDLGGQRARYATRDGHGSDGVVGIGLKIVVGTTAIILVPLGHPIAGLKWPAWRADLAGHGRLGIPRDSCGPRPG